VVLRDDQVLVQRDLHSTHILPGGRREANETPEETLRREVREETGWALAGEFLLGFMHLHHLQPAPMGHRYPYPDFLQTVYTAEAVNYAPESRLDDAYELDSTLVSLARVRELELSPHERLYLDAALREQGKQRITTPDLLDAPARD
jgi:ADP-ribose pyrophosphatase YjhB (NUDIX family)